jgi:mono/diheme cytochrome c family protein
MRFGFTLPVTLRLALVAAIPASASAADRVDFNRDIRPLLSNRCVACHGPDEAQRKAKLRLDTEEGARADLGGVAAVVPGKPEESELIFRIASGDDDEVMPPPGKGQRFSAAEIELFRRWIAQGGEYRKHWAYEPPVQVALPAVPEDWKPANEIDRFLFARLAREGLRPAPEADRVTLARRWALDLTGLPPAWEDVEAFVRDPRRDDEAAGAYVDALLAHPAFGEHWATPWLDLARYADSSGYPSDQPREIWGYRDWVIGALNRNLSFDRFTVEQLAGDLLPEPGDAQRIATAFHRNTMTQNEGGTSDEEFRTAAVVDRVNTTLAVWMGTTMACAQCHTHKFDPITQEEYFRVFAILNQSADADRKDETPVHAFYAPADQARRQALETELAALDRSFREPSAEWLRGLDAWEASFRDGRAWSEARPSAASTDAPGGAEIDPEGRILIAGNAPRAVHRVELPLPAGPLAAVRLETRPRPGFGNHVVTDFRAVLVPPDAAPGANARFVRVEVPGAGKFLQLAEVEVYRGGKNVALAGSASQSSQYTDAEARRAIDGKTDGNYAAGSVAHTGQQADPWWEVDLGAEGPVERIVVWNRTDGGAGPRLEGFRVTAMAADRTPVWRSGPNPAPGREAEFSLGGPRPLVFAGAWADHEQSGFPAASLLEADAKKRAGWAVGGAAERPHELVLTLGTHVEVPAGSVLRVEVEQASPHPNHLVGNFRIGVTGDAALLAFSALPPEIRAALGQEPSARTPAATAALREHYVRHVAPESASARSRWAAASQERDAIRPATVPVMAELPEAQRRVTKIQIRGNWQNLGAEVTPGVPAAFHPLPGDRPADRLALARWLVSRDNPLTARVTVNRFWEAVFGVGLVRTSEEFGSQGELPFHPELLDWLAVDFMEHGWDVKRLLRQLVLSRAYRQDSAVPPGLAERDPENRLLARGPRFRPPGELLRDHALEVAGLLSRKMGGPSVRPPAPNLGLSTAFGRSNDWATSTGEDRWRRSVYTEVRRNAPYASFATFDAPNREVCTIRRNRTNTPLQAFVTLNDPVFVEASQGLARRLIRDAGAAADASARLRLAYRLAVSRDPEEGEVATLRDLFDDALAEFRKDPESASRLATDPLGPAPEGVDVPELAAWTVVANVILNLDECLMRR